MGQVIADFLAGMVIGGCIVGILYEHYLIRRRAK